MRSLRRCVWLIATPREAGGSDCLLRCLSRCLRRCARLATLQESVIRMELNLDNKFSCPIRCFWVMLWIPSWCSTVQICITDSVPYRWPTIRYCCRMHCAMRSHWIVVSDYHTKLAHTIATDSNWMANVVCLPHVPLAAGRTNIPKSFRLKLHSA